MNDLLEVKLDFKTAESKGRPGPAMLPTGGTVTSEKLIQLADDLGAVSQYWIRHDGVVSGALVSAHYTRIIAKSNRLKSLLNPRNKTPDQAVCGARFGRNARDELCHVITYYVARDDVETAEGKLRRCANLVDSCFGGCISWVDLAKLHKGDRSLPEGKLSKSCFAAVVRDAFYVERFNVDETAFEIDKGSQIVTFYQTDRKVSDILAQFGIRVTPSRFLDDQTVYLMPDEVAVLQSQAPYLVAMAVKDWQAMPAVEDAKTTEQMPTLLPLPTDEPEVGVIDTLFDDKAPFAGWVKADNSYVAEAARTGPEDYRHGTEVSSIVVDGCLSNSWLEDGCGRFRVKHFGVAPSGVFSSFNVLQSIRKIVAENQQIKVWNLSLGALLEVPENAVSPEAAELDRLQSEFDVIFIVAGTNKPLGILKNMRLGAPADSINALVVNATDRRGKPASYSRHGPVLHFFNKPDVSAYGGEGKDDFMLAYNPRMLGASPVTGTSFAAPWVTRKMAFLIHKMGLSREAAKALIIDAASGWKKQDETSRWLGFGEVPRHIDDIVRAADDEIRFLVTGEISGYETFTYDIPVPVVKQTQPFFARATLCYFPKCDRNQGVDYTATELDIHFGRAKEGKTGAGAISSLNGNRQDNPGFLNISEQVARSWFRKWDNVKVISDVLSERAKPRKLFTKSGSWGLSIKVKERGPERQGQGLKFAVVVTLKEMNGINRVDEFIKRCQARGVYIKNINVENRLEINTQAEVTIDMT
mgnify:CR=1 FL=1